MCLWEAARNKSKTGDFDGYWEAFAENVRNNFDPLLAILRKLTQEIPDATALVEQLVKDPVKERSTVSGGKCYSCIL